MSSVARSSSDVDGVIDAGPLDPGYSSWPW